MLLMYNVLQCDVPIIPCSLNLTLSIQYYKVTGLVYAGRSSDIRFQYMYQKPVLLLPENRLSLSQFGVVVYIFLQFRSSTASQHSGH